MYSSSFQNRRIGQRKKSSTSRIIGIFFLILISIFFCSYFFIKSTGSLELIPKNYIIDKGTTPLTLPKILKLDVSGLRYSLWMRFFAPKNITLQAGTYEVPRSTTLSLFFQNILSKPKHTDLTITILPGWNIYDIDNYLVGKGIARAGDFLTDIEMNFDIYKREFSFLE
jgi:cell division protein YceG involved in septum cleavage